MILLLSQNGRMSIQDLAEQLDTNPRNVRAYKEEIVNVGFDIISTTGRNGGYELKNKKMRVEYTGNH